VHRDILTEIAQKKEGRPVTNPLNPAQTLV
jgi:hypothetical protein